MIAALDEWISIPSLIWLFLAAFMLHDFEEIIRIEPWFRKHADIVYPKIPVWFRKNFRELSQMTTPQFSFAVCLEFIIFIPVTFWAAERGSYLPFIGFNVMLLLHVFMHLGQALYLKMVVPGVVTAVLITLPYSLYLFYRMLDENLVNMVDLLRGAPFGLLLVPIILVGHKWGEKLIPHPSHTKKGD